MLVLSVSNSRTKTAVFRLRPGELSLDNAFSLIEGHPAIQKVLVELARCYEVLDCWKSYVLTSIVSFHNTSHKDVGNVVV